MTEEDLKVVNLLFCIRSCLVVTQDIVNICLCCFPAAQQMVPMEWSTISSSIYTDCHPVEVSPLSEAGKAQNSAQAAWELLSCVGHLRLLLLSRWTSHAHWLIHCAPLCHSWQSACELLSVVCCYCQGIMTVKTSTLGFNHLWATCPVRGETQQEITG